MSNMRPLWTTIMRSKNFDCHKRAMRDSRRALASIFDSSGVDLRPLNNVEIAALKKELGVDIEHSAQNV
ncbi:hypothetical protein ACFLVO_02785 [Chloroflexota bacterium]